MQIFRYNMNIRYFFCFVHIRTCASALRHSMFVAKAVSAFPSKKGSQYQASFLFISKFNPVLVSHIAHAILAQASEPFRRSTFAGGAH